jgi:putative ABC transport system permease protein
MSWVRLLITRLFATARSEAIREEIEREMRAHLEMVTRANLERGMSPEQSRAEALKRFGNPGRMQDLAYDVRGGGLPETLWQDLRFCARLLLKDRGFTAVAVLTVALGVGANTAIFSVVNTILLHPLSYPNPDQLVMVWDSAVKLGLPKNDVAPANFLDWRAQNDVFTDMAAFGASAVSLTGRGDPERLEGTRVSAGLFPLLGVTPALGRVFAAAEDSFNATAVVVLSHSLWKRRFGGDPGLIGQSITLDDRPHMVIGVMPADFRFPDADQELWMPMAFEPAEAAGRGDHYLRVVARLKPGVTIGQAQTQMSAIAARLESQYPRTNTGQGVALVPLHEELVGDFRRPLLILLAVAGFVLMIACANVANLLLARATTRQKELTIRVALGAGRRRLMRQLLTESLLLALLGGVAGTALSLWVGSVLGAIIPEELVQARRVVFDGRVFTFSAILTLLSGVIFGLMPALHASRLNVAEQLKEGGHANLGERSRGRLRAGLVIAEIALSFVLLTGAGLMIKSLHRLISVDPGFQPDKVLTVRMHLSGQKYGDAAKRRSLYESILQRAQSLPGVEAAGVITQLPLASQGLHFTFSRKGQPPMPGANLPMAVFRVISADYFRVMRIPLLRGRTFIAQDKADSEPVAIINRTMAEQIWPGEDALGQQFKVGFSDSLNPWLTVVGLVGDVRQTSLDQQLKPEMYVPYAQDRRFFAIPRDLVIRTANDPLAIAAAVRHRIWEVDRDLPLFRVRSMTEVLARSVAERRFEMLLLSAFAALALILALVGIYGLVSYALAQRTQEIQIRIALGAQSRDVLWLLLGHGLRLTIAGVIAGSAGAMALTQVIASLLFGVSPSDPSTFAEMALLLTTVSLLACYVPAHRVTRLVR